MLKLNECIFLIVLGVLQVKNAALAMTTEEVMDFSCTVDDQCEYYKADNIKSTCLNGFCHCYNKETNTKTICRPEILYENNIIGGYCPCNLPNAECHPTDNLCYCTADYVPTKDRRRCIIKEVPLSEICETDEQCMGANAFSHCANDTKSCTCNDNFHKKDGVCFAQTKLRPKCTNELKCSHNGPNQVCLSAINECVCEQGYVSANNSEECLPGRRFNEECRNTMQCLAVMGPGASCENGKCRCNEEKFAAVKRKLADGSLKYVCEPLARIGQYCSANEHCHNGHENENEQLMECDHGECVCRFGMKNQEPCNASMASRVFASETSAWFMFSVAFLKLRAL